MYETCTLVFLFCQRNDRVVAQDALIALSYFIIIHPRAVTTQVLNVHKIFILEQKQKQHFFYCFLERWDNMAKMKYSR